MISFQISHVIRLVEVLEVPDPKNCHKLWGAKRDFGNSLYTLECADSCQKCRPLFDYFFPILKAGAISSPRRWYLLVPGI